MNQNSLSLHGRKHMRLYVLIAACLAGVYTNGLKAQVTIGDEAAPRKGAVLDLKATNSTGYIGGQLLPHVHITDLEYIPEDYTDIHSLGQTVVAGKGVDKFVNLEGMMVYNKNEATGKGVYIWDGDKWKLVRVVNESTEPCVMEGDCDGDGEPTETDPDDNNPCTPAVSGISATANPASVGAGAESTITVTCASGTINNLSIDGGNTFVRGNTIKVYPSATSAYTVMVNNCPSQVVNATVNVKYLAPPVITGHSNLNQSVLERNTVYGNVTSISITVSGQDLVYQWYEGELGSGTPIFGANTRSYLPASKLGRKKFYCVVSNAAGSATSQQFTVTLGCGAYNGKEWLVFMCYNLGADYDNIPNPFTPAAGLHGEKYKFGSGSPALSMADDQSLNGTINNWASKPFQDDEENWREANNPCPSGFRVPTYKEWSGVLSNNSANSKTAVGTSWVTGATNYSSGMQIGDRLFLPTVGQRFFSDGDLMNRGEKGYYWSSTRGSSVPELTKRAQCIIVENTDLGYALMTSANRNHGFAVRCVAD